MALFELAVPVVQYSEDFVNAKERDEHGVATDSECSSKNHNFALTDAKIVILKQMT